MSDMSFWNQEDDKTQLLEDMGFERWGQEPPYWAVDLAERIIDSGWRRKKK